MNKSNQRLIYLKLNLVFQELLKCYKMKRKLLLDTILYLTYALSTANLWMNCRLTTLGLHTNGKACFLKLMTQKCLLGHSTSLVRLSWATCTTNARVTKRSATISLLSLMMTSPNSLPCMIRKELSKLMMLDTTLI
jgi:hypothetical protein